MIFTYHHPPDAILPREQQRLQDEITTMKGAFQEDKELNAKRHEDLLAILTALQAKLSPLLLRSALPHLFLFLLHPVPFLYFCLPMLLRTLVT